MPKKENTDAEFGSTGKKKKSRKKHPSFNYLKTIQNPIFIVRTMLDNRCNNSEMHFVLNNVSDISHMPIFTHF